MRYEKGVVLLSGGLDSTLCATMAVKDLGRKNVQAISIAYGQKHEKEVQAAIDVSKALGIVHEIWEISHVFEGYGSTLIDKDKSITRMSYQEISQARGVSPTYVPFRNGVLLSYAAVCALKSKASLIYFGAHSEDARNWAYPDCTPEFIGAMANAIYTGTYRKVRLLTPLQWYTKVDIIKKSVELGAPYQLTWSCYEGGIYHCGMCPTCVSRSHAFIKAGVPDPTKYYEGGPNDKTNGV